MNLSSFTYFTYFNLFLLVIQVLYFSCYFIGYLFSTNYYYKMIKLEFFQQMMISNIILGIILGFLFHVIVITVNHDAKLAINICITIFSLISNVVLYGLIFGVVVTLLGNGYNRLVKSISNIHNSNKKKRGN